MATDEVQLCLHQQLFLIAHDRDGGLRLHQPTLRLGLAGAVVAELVLAEHLRIRDNTYLTFPPGTPPADPLSAAVLVAMTRPRAARQVSHALRAIAVDMYDRVSGGLLAAGLVTRDTRRRLSSIETRYPHTDPELGGKVLARVRYATHGRDLPDPPTLTMCGLVGVLGLQGRFEFAQPATEVLSRLQYLVGCGDPQIQHLINLIDSLVGAVAVAAYR
jgi:hypothetical protein